VRIARDIYAGIEFRDGTPEVEEFKKLFARRSPSVQEISFPGSSGIGLKPISREGTGTPRSRRHRIRIASEHAKSRHARAQGQHHEVFRGRVRDWGYALAKREFGARSGRRTVVHACPGGIVIKDVIADAFLQQILTRPADYDVVATPNLNGDNILGRARGAGRRHRIAPGGNINYVTARHLRRRPTGPRRSMRTTDKVNPVPVILSGRDDAALPWDGPRLPTS
jgi:isocitrate dehydrogenase